MGIKVHIKNVEGEIVALSDGSRVRVSSLDAGEVKWWSPSDDIEKEPMYLINVTKGKKVATYSA